MERDGLPYPREEKVESESQIWPKPAVKMYLAFLPTEICRVLVQVKLLVLSQRVKKAGYLGCSRNRLLKFLPAVSLVLPCTPVLDHQVLFRAEDAAQMLACMRTHVQSLTPYKPGVVLQAVGGAQVHSYHWLHSEFEGH